LGLNFGFHGGLDKVHEIALRAFNDLELFGYLTRPTLSQFEDSLMSLDDHVIYALLHGALYCQGQPSAWAFDRIREEEFKAFVWQPDTTAYFTGEMVFRSAFDSYVELRPLKEVATILESSHWPCLYDVEQLRRNDVPVYAAVFMEDMYVPFELALQTAGLIKGCKKYITNVMYHDAIRAKTDDVMKALYALRDDSID
jgi:proline iminopeptidase